MSDGDDLRTRIAQTIYGDGDDVSWSRAVQLADLIIWEIGLRHEWTTVETMMLGTALTSRPDNPIATRVATPWQHLEPAPAPAPAPNYCLRCGIPHTDRCRRPDDA